ncbi:g10637 [Coccomyxa elongata]
MNCQLPCSAIGHLSSSLPSHAVQLQPKLCSLPQPRRGQPERCCCSASSSPVQPTARSRTAGFPAPPQALSVASPSRETSDMRGSDADEASGSGATGTQLPPNERVGVLLLNLGGPETLDDVEPFLYNLFADDSIIRLPPYARFLQRPLAKLISGLRAPKSSEGYKRIGGGSPLRRITEQQADALAHALKREGLDAKVYVGMRYWAPFIEDAMEEIKRDGMTHLIVIPLYPQFSISTSGSSLRLLEKMFESDPALSGLKHSVIASWYFREGYLRAMAELIEKELQKFDSPEKTEIFFSAHGVPVSYVEQDGDPYRDEMEQCVGMIMQRLQQRGVHNSYSLAYQSRVGPVEWLQPYTDAKIRELGASGVKQLLAVPISFVSEHIETLEEIDMEYRELALESGVQHWGRVPALNTNPTFINDLADMVLEKLPSAAPRPGYVPSLDDSMNLGPIPGRVEEILQTYDRERRVLPAPVRMWQWGWTKSAETWNGRIAMLAVLTILLLEVTTGQGVLTHWLRL